MNLPPPHNSAVPPRGRRSLARRLAGRGHGDPDIFSSERSFAPPIGTQLGASGELRGYYIDFSVKVHEPVWPPSWLRERDEQLHIATVQWALGAWERYLKGDGDAWRQAAISAGDHLLSAQQRDGVWNGAWLHWFPMPHTYRIEPPWVSGIAQGEGASLMARLFAGTGDERYAEAARRALAPMRLPTASGGVLSEIDGLPFFEEYPTTPDSLVLNGGIFALWGFHDVARALDDVEAKQWFEGGLDALVNLLPRYDTGYWSRYDLFPHPVINVASAAYHLLHVKQLEILASLSERDELTQASERFDSYRDSALGRRRAFAHKVLFRALVPRNALLAHKLPWNTHARGNADAFVLCYHAVSEDWESSLAVSPELLEGHLKTLLRAGYTPVTFSEAVRGGHREKVFAVTFDDAYESIERLARPVMEPLGVPGTVFVPTAQVGAESLSWPGIDQWRDTPRARELQPLSWRQLRDLAGAGWEIGSHTRTHPKLTQIPPERRLEELVRSREECEREIGGRCLSVAYPYGDEDIAVARAAVDAGYATGASLPPPYNERSTMSWPRTGIYGVDGPLRFRIKRSRLARRVRRTVLGDALASAFHARGDRPEASS